MKKTVLLLFLLPVFFTCCYAGVDCVKSSNLGDCIEEKYNSNSFDQFTNIEGVRIIEYGHVNEYPIDMSNIAQVEMHYKIRNLLHSIYFKRADKELMLKTLSDIFSTCNMKGESSPIGVVCKEMLYDIIGNSIKISKISLDDLLTTISNNNLLQRGTVELKEHYTPIVDYYSFVQKEYKLGKYLLGVAETYDYLDQNKARTSLYVLQKGDNHWQRFAILEGKHFNRSSLTIKNGKLIRYFPVKQEIKNKNIYYTISYYELQSNGNRDLIECKLLDATSDNLNELNMAVCEDFGKEISITTVYGNE